MGIKNPKGSFWIDSVEPEQATGELARLYGEWEGRNGTVPSFLPGLSSDLDQMKRALHLITTVQEPTESLDQLRRQMIIVVISKALDCEFATHLHAGLLRRQESADTPKGQSLADLFEQGRWREAGLDEKDQRMVEFAEMITVNAIGVEKQHIQDLRDVGFSDRDIFDIVHLTSTFNYFNRLIMALGHKHPDDWLPKLAQTLPAS